MKQLTIQEWFAISVAAGLMPEWENIYARCIIVADMSYCCIRNSDESDNICTQSNLIEQFDEEIQLRSKGKDLYSSEWRKPTEQDVGKMCWFYSRLSNVLSLTQLESKEEEFYYGLFSNNSSYCLLADHGQLAPTEADFKQVYGE